MGYRGQSPGMAPASVNIVRVASSKGWGTAKNVICLVKQKVFLTWRITSDYFFRRVEVPRRQGLPALPINAGLGSKHKLNPDC